MLFFLLNKLFQSMCLAWEKLKTMHWRKTTVEYKSNNNQKM